MSPKGQKWVPRLPISEKRELQAIGMTCGSFFAPFLPHPPSDAVDALSGATSSDGAAEPDTAGLPVPLALAAGGAVLAGTGALALRLRRRRG